MSPRNDLAVFVFIILNLWPIYHLWMFFEISLFSKACRFLPFSAKAWITFLKLQGQHLAVPSSLLVGCWWNPMELGDNTMHGQWVFSSAVSIFHPYYLSLIIRELLITVIWKSNGMMFAFDFHDVRIWLPSLKTIYIRGCGLIWTTKNSLVKKF